MNKLLRFSFVALLALVCASSFAQDKTLPYEETFATSQGDFTIDNKTLPDGLNYVWKEDTKYKCMKASAYYKKNYAAESWLISPVIDLTSAKEPELSFEHAGKFFDTAKYMEHATLMVKAGDGDWEQVEIPTYFTNSNYTFKTATISLSKYAGKKIQFAFKYVSTSEHAGTWEVKNVSVKDKNATNISNIKADTNADSPLYNLAGQRVSKSYKGVVIKNGKKVLVK